MKRHSLKSEHENSDSKLGGSMPWNDCGVGIPIGNAATMLTLKGRCLLCLSKQNTSYYAQLIGNCFIFAANLVT